MGAAGVCGLGDILSVARTFVAVGCSETSSSTVSTSQSGGRYWSRRTGRACSVRMVVMISDSAGAFVLKEERAIKKAEGGKTGPRGEKKRGGGPGKDSQPWGRPRRACC